ncbi:MAG: hypothetical protein JXP34_18000 [Planctomycetes bacterium]|nr:hypothetical protein [Planctomycetota bacterium]
MRRRVGLAVAAALLGTGCAASLRKESADYGTYFAQASPARAFPEDLLGIDRAGLAEMAHGERIRVARRLGLPANASDDEIIAAIEARIAEAMRARAPIVLPIRLGVIEARTEPWERLVPDGTTFDPEVVSALEPLTGAGGELRGAGLLRVRATAAPARVRVLALIEYDWVCRAEAGGKVVRVLAHVTLVDVPSGLVLGMFEVSEGSPYHMRWFRPAPAVVRRLREKLAVRMRARLRDAIADALRKAAEREARRGS